jgi:hypothetical protein
MKTHDTFMNDDEIHRPMNEPHFRNSIEFRRTIVARPSGLWKPMIWKDMFGDLALSLGGSFFGLLDGLA